jgi:hypothetical protein
VVPLSSCYRRARELVDEGLLLVERIVITGDGKRYGLYRSPFATIEIESDLASTSVSAVLNNAVAEKFHHRHLIMSYETAQGGVLK